MRPKEYKKKADLNTKAGKYFLAKKHSRTKKEAALSVGLHPSQVSHIENTKTYQAIEKKYYKDILLAKVSLEKIADEHLKVLMQDDELSPKLKAIEMAKEYIEPDASQSDTDEAVVFILKK